MRTAQALDGKKKKRKGTLGVGNGSLFFASESDKQPVQKISVLHIVATAAESKGKQVNLELDAAAGLEDNALRFVMSSKSEGEAVVAKIEESKAIAEENGVVKPPPATRSMPPPLAGAASRTSSSVAAAPVLPPPARAGGATLPPPQRKTEAPAAAASNGHAQGEPAMALYDFEAQGDDEISVAENEPLTLVERENEDWWKVRNARGEEGVVPASYVEVTDGAGAAAAADDDDDDAAAAAAAEEEERREQQEAMEATRRTKEAAARRAREAEDRRREALKAQPAPAPPRAAAPAAPTASVRDVPIPAGRSVPERPKDAGGKSRPNPARTRVWHDRSAQFRVEAEFLGFNQGKIRLHKLNGVVIEVAVEKMSNADIQYLEDVTGKRLAPSSIGRGEARGEQRRSSAAASSADPRRAEREREKRKEAEREARRRQESARGPKRNVDWFEFFLAAGVDVDDCTRYAAAFERDKIDEAILPDMEPGTLRSIGLREGDIIRVDKFIKR